MHDWNAILHHDGPAAWRAAYRVLGNRADADECYQEACAEAFVYSKSSPGIRNWRALLQRFATARAIDRLRARARRRVRESALPIKPLSTETPPPVRVENAELAAKLRAALVHLPSRQAEAFCLFYFEGWTYAQIAESLEISTDLVGVWLERARGRLKELLNGIPSHQQVPHD